MTRVSMFRVLFAVCMLLLCASAVRAQDDTEQQQQLQETSAQQQQQLTAEDIEFDASQQALLELYTRQQQMEMAEAAASLEADAEAEAEEGELLNESHFDTQLDMEEANMDRLEAEEYAQEIDAMMLETTGSNADEIGVVEREIGLKKCAATPKRADCKALYCKLAALRKRIARKKKQKELEDEIGRLKQKIQDEKDHIKRIEKEPSERKHRRDEEEHRKESARRKKKLDEERAAQEAKEKAENEEKQKKRRAAEDKAEADEIEARRRAREARRAAKLKAIKAARKRRAHLKVRVDFHPNGDVHFPHHRHNWTPANNTTRKARFSTMEEGEEADSEAYDEAYGEDSYEGEDEDAQLSYLEMSHPDDAAMAKWTDAELPARLNAAKARLAALEQQLAKLEAELRALLALPAIGFECPKVIHSPFGFKTACASGDPHFDSYDGAHHDTMIAGWFTWAENSVLTVQGYTQLGCMPPQYPNTCLRASVVRIRPPGTGDSLIVSWGQWPPTGHMQNVIIQDSSNPGANVNVPFAQFGSKNFLNNQYSVSRSGGNIVVKPVGDAAADPELAVSVTWGAYYMAVTLPNIAPHKGLTNGLMGAYPGHGNRADMAGIFKMRNGAPSGITQAMLGTQHVAVRNWAATFVVTAANGANPPIGSVQNEHQQQKYLNAHHQNGFLEMAHAQTAVDDFNPNPVATKPVILPSIVPKVTKKDLDFCHKMLDGENKKKLAEIKGRTKPLTATQLKQVKEKMDAQLKSCLQDAKAPTVAKAVGAVIKVAKVQQKAAKKALKTVIKKQMAVAEAKQKAADVAEENAPFEEPIIYNSDSPVSEEEKRLIALAHSNVVVTHVPLLSQDDLDRAQFAIDDADKAKKELLTQYPTLE